ncbi:MAG: ATP-binding protein [Bacteroidota bacterium]
MLKGFTSNILIRIFLMALLMAGLGYFLFRTDFYISAGMMVVLIGFLIWDLIRYTNQTNRDITTFLTGIKYDDFALRFSGDKKGRSFQQMYNSFNQINSKFLEIRAEKEAQFLYLQNIVESAEVGLLCVDQNGEVILINRELKKLLGKPYLISFEFLSRVNKDLYKGLLTMENGDRKLLRINLNDQLLQLSIQARKFKIKDDLFSLYSVQNIQNELEVQEVRSWQKLIRILTHEIMNSVTPIISLSSAVHDRLGDQDRPLEKEDIQEMAMAISAIQKRTEGLLHFTDTYRKLTKVPPPVFQEVDLGQLTERIHTLFKPVLKTENIQFELSPLRGPLLIQADPRLLEQVLINLIKNAIDAFDEEQEERHIRLSCARLSVAKCKIQLADNGPGIPLDLLDQIFVPFYTTKKEGSGIGLSLSRQIIQMHQGTINVESKVGAGTVFTILL